MDAIYQASPKSISASDAAHGVVFRTDNIECIYHDRGSEILLVTFNEMGAVANGRFLWCSNPSEQLNISIFGFVSTRPNWFPWPDMKHCLQAFRAHTHNKAYNYIVVIGLSQGAYAALKFHRMLEADISIAFSPQISIDPSDVVDPRFNKYFDPIQNIAMRVEGNDISPHCYLFYDPYDKYDAKHAGMLEDLGILSSLRLPYVGHASVRMFLGSKNLWELIQACLNADLRRIRALYAAHKRGNVERPQLVAHAAAEKRPHIALRIFEKYGRPGKDLRWLHTCWRISEAGFSLHVLSWLKDFVQDNPENDNGRECLCLVAIRADARDMAIEISQELLNADPNNPRRRYIWDLARAVSR